MSSVDQSAVFDALRSVKDPDLHRDIVALGFVKDLQIDGGRVAFTIELTTPACPVKDAMRDQARAAVSARARRHRRRGDDDGRRPQRRRAMLASAQAPMPGVRNVVAVGAGKGGVGKTTLAVNLAAALAARGSRVGMIDGDIYGPNVPIMLGMQGQLEADGDKIVPAEKLRHQGRLDGLSHRRRVARHLARTDAAQRDPAVLPRGAVGRAGLPGRRHAAGHRRRRAEPQPDGSGGRRDRRHDAAGGVARRQPARRADVPEAEHPGARPHREHELLRLPELRSTRATSSAAAAASGRRRRWRCRSSAGSRSTSRSAAAATPA